MARTARQRRAEEKRTRHIRELNEYVSTDHSAVHVRCPKGHHMRSHSLYDGKGRTKAVVWSCNTCGAQTTVQPEKKKGPPKTMAASKTEIRAWLNEAKEKGATHMLVVCDTYDYEDYPVFVMPGDVARDVSRKYDGKEMQRVMECYSLSMDIDKQLSEHRAHHYD